MERLSQLSKISFQVCATCDNQEPKLCIDEKMCLRLHKNMQLYLRQVILLYVVENRCIVKIFAVIGLNIKKIKLLCF